MQFPESRPNVKIYHRRASKINDYNPERAQVNFTYTLSENRSPIQYLFSNEILASGGHTLIATLIWGEGESENDLPIRDTPLSSIINANFAACKVEIE